MGEELNIRMCNILPALQAIVAIILKDFSNPNLATHTQTSLNY